MIIVEGPDGGGKTSLITRLQDELHFQVQPRACTSDNGIDPGTLREWVDRDLSGIRNRGFYDRHPLISEPIYGPLIRGRMADGFSEVSWMASRLNLFKMQQPLMIFCLPPFSEVQKNIEMSHEPTTKHLRGVRTHARALYELYCLRASQETSEASYATIVWDYTHQHADIEFRAITSMCRGYLS